MSKVKASRKKTAARKTGARKTAGRARSGTRSGTRRGATKRGGSARGSLRDVFGRYASASAAGVLVVGALLGVVLWAGGYVGRVGAGLSDATARALAGAGLDVRRVTLRGARNTAHADIVDALGPLVGESILHVDTDALRAKVETLGWVRAASVTRLLPDTVHVSIREREPGAVWQVDGAFRLVDDAGAIIRPIGAYEYSQLPMIVGAGAPEAASDILRALKTRDELARNVYALVRVGRRRWNLRLRNGVDVKLPEVGAVDAVEALWRLQQAHGVLDAGIEYIDLRDPERVAVRRRPGGAAGDVAAVSAKGADQVDADLIGAVLRGAEQ